MLESFAEFIKSRPRSELIALEELLECACEDMSKITHEHAIELTRQIGRMLEMTRDALYANIDIELSKEFVNKRGNIFKV